MSTQDGSLGSVLSLLSPLKIAIGIFFLSFLGLSFYQLSEDLAIGLEGDLRTAFDQQNLTVVDIASSRVGFHIDNDVAENVRLLGQFPGTQRQEIENASRDMEKVNTVAAPRVDGFVLFDPNGDLFTVYPETMRYPYHENQAESPYFKIPKETGALYFSDWIRDEDRLKLRVSNPIYDKIRSVDHPNPDGKLSGVIMAQIDFDRTIASELGRLKSSGIMHWIIDERTGDVLYHSVLPRNLPGNVVDSSKSKLAKDLLKAFPSTVLEPGIHRAKVGGNTFSVASARSRVGPHNITVNLAYDDTAVAGLVYEKTNRIYMLGVAFLIVVLVGATITLRQMAKRQSLISEKEHLSRELALEEEKKKLSEQVSQLQKMESLGELAAGTAHELNNALTGPMGMLSLLQAKPDMDSGKRADMLNKAVNGMEQARAIVEGLLRFSRSELNEITHEDVNEDIRFVLKMYQKELEHSDILVQMDLQEDLPLIHASHRQIQQVILNLVTNSKYAMSAGGVLDLSSKAERRNGVAGVTVRVGDNGPGMTKEVQARIFEPFYSTKGVGEGTGLGLSICYGIVQDHKGTMTVTSAPGEGATFTIWIPVGKGE